MKPVQHKTRRVEAQLTEEVCAMLRECSESSGLPTAKVIELAVRHYYLTDVLRAMHVRVLPAGLPDETSLAEPSERPSRPLGTRPTRMARRTLAR